MPVGDYALPPEAIQGGYVEIKTTAKTGRAIPRLTHLAKPKRPREEETATNHLFEDKPGTEEKVTVKDLVEAINKEQVKPKTTITQGLRTVDDQSDTWAALQLHSWHETIKFKCVLGPAAIEPIIANWHFEVMKLTNDLALISGKVNPVQLRQFNAARDQVGRWLRYSGDLRMDTKRSWELPYHLLFQLVSAMVTLAYGDRRGDQAAAELKAEFDKPAAVMDLSSILNRIFRGRRPRGYGYRSPLFLLVLFLLVIILLVIIAPFSCWRRSPPNFDRRSLWPRYQLSHDCWQQHYLPVVMVGFVSRVSPYNSSIGRRHRSVGGAAFPVICDDL